MVFTKLLLNPKLLDAVEDVMETENIILHHTKAHLKPPEKGAPFPMHQDYHYFPYEKGRDERIWRFSLGSCFIIQTSTYTYSQKN